MKDYIKSHLLYLIISLLIFSGIFVKINPFFNVGVALIWCLITLFLSGSLFHILILRLPRESIKEDVIRYVKNFNDKTKSVKGLNRSLAIVNFIILAYCGWIVTSIIYLLSMIIVKITILFLKEKINET
ncbi:hypothetical protein [Arsenophonus nasoniae]|uniref:Uncharacterized protein n=1 Tax=Arsenophonus nasoniae TaxID=638 RepID=A0AA95GRX1_9GAMM|nr:hypothetical protein [Arsenophonus nasoniae]WGM01774.1 hypothetical protein QE210_01195 [Arsenophonus nasoniae]